MHDRTRSTLEAKDLKIGELYYWRTSSTWVDKDDLGNKVIYMGEHFIMSNGVRYYTFIDGSASNLWFIANEISIFIFPLNNES